MRHAVSLKLKFVNKERDDINSSNILHDKRICEKVPQYFQNKSPPVISYKYSHTVAAKILNLNATVRNIDFDDFIKSPPSCDCASSPFRYAPYIITGDFGIIPNEELKRILLKGPNNKEQTSINWGYNIKLIFTATEGMQKSGQRKKAKNMSAFRTEYSM